MNKEYEYYDIRNLVLNLTISFSESGLITNTMGKEICFEFIKPHKTRELNLLKESSMSHIEVKKIIK